MAAWLISALSLLRGFGGRAGALVGGRVGATGIATGIALPDPFNIFGGRDGDGVVRRRRRRRALTQSDKADIAFVAATLGAPAGQKFALIIASRVS